MQCSKKQAGRPMVSVEQGKLLGRRRKTKSGTGYASYTRIPFAAPPTGGRRFMHPSDPPPWEGVLDGGRPCPKPLQSNYVTGLLEGQEDCLYLNVYVPDTGDRPGVLPVMYWLYGGGFIMGDATEENYLPGPLLDTKQVVIVTANYRVGPLGFLCMEDNLLPGNLALWDQRAGLLWVKQNIHKFGGDPGNVTIFGESAGSFCLMCLYTSPLCRGLFHRAIAQSGPLISNCSALQVLGKTPQLYARSYAERLGCARSDSSEKILEYLKSVSAVRLQAIFNFAGDWAPMCPSPWKPVVDVWADTPILPKDPRQALLDGDVQCVPLITGTCRDEGLLNMSHILKEPVRWNLFSDPSWWKYLSMVLFHSHTEDLDTQDRDIMLKIAKEYDLLVPGESTILTPTTSRNSKHSKDEKIDRSEKLIQLFTDSYFKAGTLDLCQIIAQQNVPVYQYRFVYKGKWKFGDLLTLSAGGLAFKFILDTVSKGKVTLHGPLWEGVCHADELHYLFSPKLWGMKNTLADHRDKEMSRQLSTHWVNFASTGDPSTQVRWERTEVEGSNYIFLDGKERK
ncbi:para-nitrobenzyl esterase isoform X2 [Eurytemora carolleeae]|uniref:para-nitrobenzyl esterase isoform X2 n=1 Tax=Eurytemora carolleeae TaxID=1294199 RepID=UPI000C764876|nr:para-nitrobenzyl esterase isoform X2 [Eurytemora carolleeae]|eukprot:XP_023349863.1 para-nitrobenzyl esterase-like isoform X2 [Eurytemora affinis]